jgi:hypothetical protein
MDTHATTQRSTCSAPISAPSGSRRDRVYRPTQSYRIRQETNHPPNFRSRRVIPAKPPRNRRVRGATTVLAIILETIEIVSRPRGAMLLQMEDRRKRAVGSKRNTRSNTLIRIATMNRLATHTRHKSFYPDPFLPDPKRRTCIYPLSSYSATWIFGYCKPSSSQLSTSSIAPSRSCPLGAGSLSWTCTTHLPCTPSTPSFQCW